MGTADRRGTPRPEPTKGPIVTSAQAQGIVPILGVAGRA